MAGAKMVTIEVGVGDAEAARAAAGSLRAAMEDSGFSATNDPMTFQWGGRADADDKGLAQLAFQIAADAGVVVGGISVTPPTFRPPVTD